MTDKEVKEAIRGLTALQITMALILLRTYGKESALEFIRKVKEHEERE